MQGMNLGGFFGADPEIKSWEVLILRCASCARGRRICVSAPEVFATSFAAIYETWQIDFSFQTGRWVSVGARPTYFFSEHYSVAFEAGARMRNCLPRVQRQAIHSCVFLWRRNCRQPQSSSSRPVLRAYITDSTSSSTRSGFSFPGRSLVLITTR